MKKLFLLLFLCVVIVITFYFKIYKVEEYTKIGASDIESTSKKLGKFFISVDGKGKECSIEKPCGLDSLDLSKGFLQKRIKAGDVIFFRGGIYHFSINGIKRVYLKGGTKDNPVIYESYPKEIAIFDGSKISTKDISSEDWREGKLQLRDNYITLRKVEIENMPQQGVRIFGNHNIIEGCRIHNNHLSGIDINSFKRDSLDAGGSYNIIRNNYIYNNSDANLSHHNYKSGDNADGIIVGKGKGNIISLNNVYSNSDDGIDTWQSIDTLVEYNLAYKNGRGKKGNGNGIKLGGASKNSLLGRGAVARHNLSYNNRYMGFNINSGKDVIIEYNTAYNNNGYGYTIADDTIIRYNISFHNKKGDIAWSNGREQIGNSWQLDKNITKDSFKSLNKTSSNFLIPINKLKSLGAITLSLDK